MSDESGNTPSRTEQRAPVFFNISKFALIAVLVCSVLCVIFMRTPVLSMFYLMPLGCAVILSGSYWIAFIAAAAVNIIVCAFTNALSPVDIAYISGMFLVFSWMIGGKVPRGLYRFFIMVIAGTVSFFVVVNPNDSFAVLFEMLVTELAPGVPSAEFMEAVNGILIRGGALVSMCFMFFVNRYLAITAAWLIKRQRNDRRLTEFFAPSGLIWVLSGAIATILLSVLFKFQIIEIIAWNVFIICAIIYLAQGAGILMHMLTKRSSAFRMGAGLLAFVLILSPLSVIAVAAMLILGIAENWVPIRLAKKTQ